MKTGPSELEGSFCHLVTYMLVSAKSLVENKAYGPARLIETCSRLIEILEGQGLSSVSLSKIKAKIDENKDYCVMADEKVFIAFLDTLIAAMIERLDAT